MQVNVKTHDGVHYLCAEGGGGSDGRIVANRTEPGAWETFHVERIDETHIALKSSGGFYVCAESGGGRELVANRTERGAWETFEVVPLEDGIALRASGGQFVCAEGDGGGAVVANRAEAGAWETFFPSEPLTGRPNAGSGAPADAQPVTQLLRRLGNRFFTADGHTPFDYREISGFALYRRWLNGESLEEYCAYLRRFKITSARVILTLSGSFWVGRGTNCGPSVPGFYERLRAFTQYLASQGLYVRYCLVGGLEEFGVNPPNRGSHYTRECHRRILAYVERVVTDLRHEPNVLWEVMNEFNQIGASNAEAEIADIAWLIKSIAPHLVNLSNMNGPTADEPAFVRTPADFVDSHLERRRGIAGFEWVKRSSESPVVDQDDMPFLSGEPINFGTPAPGRPEGHDNERSTAVAFAAGATSRCKQYYTTFHYEDGLDAKPPNAETEPCLAAWMRGLDAIPIGFNGRWCNGHHACSPFRSDIYPGHHDSEDRWRGPIRIFGLSGGDGYIGVSIREPAHNYEPPLKSGRNVREIARETYGDWCSVVRAE